MRGSNVKIEGIEKNFDGVQVLKNINFEIKAGEFFSILGPSGCGKTTLLRMIAGFIEADNGCIYLGEDDISKLPPNKRNVNTIFQTYALFPHLSVFDNVAFPLNLKKESKNKIKEEVEKYLEMVQLKDHMYKLPNQLSGGQKQRVAIARALINQPSVLLLDEPLSALDAKLRQHMLIELDNIHDKVGVTFVFVTHDQQEALSVSDRIAVMNQGEVLQIGTPNEIYEKPSNSFVADFIGESNFIEGKVIDVHENYAIVSSRIFGDIKFDIDKKVSLGSTVKLTLRPEKIKISKTQPKNIGPKDNTIKAKVEDIIYSGFQSKFYLIIEGSDIRFKAFKQHADFFEEDEQTIHWEDEVYATWNYEDSFLIEVL